MIYNIHRAHLHIPHELTVRIDVELRGLTIIHQLNSVLIQRTEQLGSSHWLARYVVEVAAEISPTALQAAVAKKTRFHWEGSYFSDRYDVSTLIHQ